MCERVSDGRRYESVAPSALALGMKSLGFLNRVIDSRVPDAVD